MIYTYTDREGRKWRLNRVRASEMPRFIRADREDGVDVSVHVSHVQCEGREENNGNATEPRHEG